MSSLIVRTATRYLVPLLLLFSLFLLWRGHQEPGGGFAGGLVAATAFVLVALAEGTGPSRELLRIEPQRLVPLGLLTSAIAGLIGPLQGRPFLTGAWPPVLGELGLGSPLLFDLGVYLTVLGVVLTVLLTLMEDAT